MASEDTTAPTLIAVEDAAAAGDSAPERLTYEIPEELKGELSSEATEQLKAILELQKDHDGEHEKMVAEFLALELKYEAIFQTFYAKRSALLTAKENVIPKFWLKAFKNSQIAELIESYDEPILEHLQDVRYEILPGNTGFRLIFQFAPNDYFTNTELTKTLEVDDMFGEEEIVSSKGCTINWKPNKDVTVQLKSKPAPRRGRGGRGRGGRGGASKPVAVKVPSFFRFFEDAPSLDDLADDLDEEDFMQIAQQEDVDNQLAQIIREVIISRAAVLFTGEDVGEDEEEDPHDHGDDDDDDSEEEEEPIQKPKKKRNNRNRGRGGNQVEEVDSDEDGKKSSAPSLSFPSFGTAPAFNFNFAAGAGTTLGAGAGTSLGGPQRQFNFNPTPAAAAAAAAAATSTPPADNKSA